MEVGDLRFAILVMLYDVQASEELLTPDVLDQFERRTFLRSLFAYIEGTIRVFKDFCIKGVFGDGTLRQLSPSEHSILYEESYELKSNGEVKTSPKFLKLADNLKFTFKSISKLVSQQIDFDDGSNGWNAFLRSISVRNRITHPKNIDSLIISNDEIEDAKITARWIDDLYIRSLNAIEKGS